MIRIAGRRDSKSILQPHIFELENRHAAMVHFAAKAVSSSVRNHA